MSLENKRDKVLIFRTTKEIREKLEKMAEESCRTLSGQLNFLIKKGLLKEGGK